MKSKVCTLKTQCGSLSLLFLDTNYYYKGTLANREDQDEMLPEGAFHQGLHSLLSTKQSSGT